MLVSLFKLINGRCKMLDIIPKWFLLMAINFFVLLFLLNIILFKPFLKIFKERDDTVKNSLEAAKDMNNKREESISRMNRELADARAKAKQFFDELRADGLAKQKEVQSKAEAEALVLLDKARADLRSEAEKVRKELKAEVDKFSDEIVRKLVKV
jgi:F-type H+-transporting ATPase subunit b